MRGIEESYRGHTLYSLMRATPTVKDKTELDLILNRLLSYGETRDWAIYKTRL